MYVHHLYDVPAEAQKMTSDPLELRVVVSCHVGAENQASVLCKNSKWSWLQNYLSSSKDSLKYS